MLRTLMEKLLSSQECPCWLNIWSIRSIISASLSLIPPTSLLINSVWSKVSLFYPSTLWMHHFLSTPYFLSHIRSCGQTSSMSSCVWNYGYHFVPFDLQSSITWLFQSWWKAHITNIQLLISKLLISYLFLSHIRSWWRFFYEQLCLDYHFVPFDLRPSMTGLFQSWWKTHIVRN